MKSIKQGIEEYLLTCERCGNRFYSHTGKTHVGKPGDILCSAECYKQKHPTDHLTIMITGSRNLSKSRLPTGVSVDNMIRDQIRLFFCITEKVQRNICLSRRCRWCRHHRTRISLRAHKRKQTMDKSNSVSSERPTTAHKTKKRV